MLIIIAAIANKN